MNLLIEKENPSCLFEKAHPSDAGYDLSSNQTLVLKAGERFLIETGIKIALPRGTYGRIAPRSGLAYKNGIDVLGGVIDENYRGEVKVILLNTGKEDVSINKYDKIAQLIVEYVVATTPVIVTSLDTRTDRGANGFGSTNHIA